MTINWSHCVPYRFMYLHKSSPAEGKIPHVFCTISFSFKNTILCPGKKIYTRVLIMPYLTGGCSLAALVSCLIITIYING